MRFALLACLIAGNVSAECEINTESYSAYLMQNFNFECALVRTLSGPSEVCHYPFTFRAAEAGTLADTLSAQILTCGGEALSVEPGVNHPDSYDQRLYSLRGTEISVAVKDKGALGQTLVFVTITRP